MRDCPKAKANMREENEVSTNIEEGVPKAKGRFFSLKSKDDQE